MPRTALLPLAPDPVGCAPDRSSTPGIDQVIVREEVGRNTIYLVDDRIEAENLDLNAAKGY